MQSKPVRSAGVAACLDFSVEKRGYLTAYRWSGEQLLDGENLFFVRAGDFSEVKCLISESTWSLAMSGS